MADLEFFLNLITSEYRYQPKFQAWASVLLQGLVDAQNTAAQLPTIFDLDTAVGDQLDKVGQWIGLTRYITELEPAFFSWDVPGLGWGQAPWKSPYSAIGSQIVVLDDYHYRVLLKARVAANSWDGTIEGAYTAWRTLFADEGFQVLIQNISPKAPSPSILIETRDWSPDFSLDFGPAYPFANDGMHILLALIGPPIDALTQALFNGGYLNMTPAGVTVDAYVTQTVPGRPMFAWGVGPASVGDYTAPPVNLAGWGMSAWGNFSMAPLSEVSPKTVVADARAVIEDNLTRRHSSHPAIETAQGIGPVIIQTSAFTAGVPNGIVSIIQVTMAPATPAFSGTLALTGTNSGGFVIGTAAGAPVILQQSAGTPAGVYTDFVITASQTGMTSRAVSPRLAAYNFVADARASIENNVALRAASHPTIENA
jgi:hypothetical protein